MSYNKADNKYYGYIYKITNNINKKVYIGQTRRTINIRFQQHIIESKREDNHTILYVAFRKYGIENFNIELVKEYSYSSKTELIEILNEEEIKYISEYNSLKPNGYNIQIGGKSATESLKCPVDKYLPNGEYIRSYESVSEAALDFEIPINRSHISECCKGKLCVVGGFVWRYKGEPFCREDFKKDKRNSAVSVFAISGDYINTYDTIKSAMIDLLGDYYSDKSSHISACCKGTRKSAYGFVWKYAS